MKLTKIATLSLLISATNVFAANLPMPNASNTVKPANVQQPDFGMFVIQKSLTTVPSYLAQGENVVKELGSLAIVTLPETKHSENTILQRGSVVKSLLNDQLVVVTGNLSVLLEDGVNIEDVTENYPLSVSKNFANTGLSIVTADKNVDLIALLNNLRKDARVKSARLDIPKFLNEPM